MPEYGHQGTAPRQQFMVVQRKFDLATYYNFDLFPDMKKDLRFDEFTVPLIGKDRQATQKMKDICQQDQNKLIDLRPYMIENPETINKFDYLPKILRRFLHMHLRHLIVVNPVTGLLEGMVTRQDLFTWLPL